jgi:hypothetical protein
MRLRPSERRGISIHYCPQCFGVWMDREQLDRLVELSSTETQPPRAADLNPGHDDDRHVHFRRSRRKSIMEELFRY